MRRIFSRSDTWLELVYIVRFLLVGILNSLIGLGVIFACKYFWELGDIPANIVGYAAGLTNSFLWNRRWTFSHSGNVALTVARFLLVFVVAYSANLATALTLIRSLHIDSYVAHAVAVIPYTALFYIGSRYFVFAVSRARKPENGS